ncbi:MAG TPA: hypothetical protein VHL59_15005 [Thermoanaerobaculia bacterium]|nr:hypothetical protein [Thermoanaerobaculia bacterium]
MTNKVPGDGGIYSSIDFALWNAALYEPRFQRALVPAADTDLANAHYGW